MQLSLQGIVNYQGVIKTSTFFEILIYSDTSLSYKVYEDLTSLNYQTIVNQLNINSFNFSPTQVQVLSTYFFEIELINGLDETNMSQNRYTLTLPSQLRFGNDFVSEMLGKGKKLCTTLAEFIEFTGQNSSALCEMEQDSLIRVYQFYQKQNKIGIRIKQIMNPYSTENTQPFLIVVEIQKGSNTHDWLKVYQNNQLEETTIVKATSGEISVQKFESIGSQTTFDISSYFISFDITSRLIPSSYIIISFPQDDFLFNYMNFANCSCEFSEGLITAKSKCTFDNRNLVEIELQSEQSLQVGQRVSVFLRGMRNPRSLKPTKPIMIQTLSPSKSVIDEIQSGSDKQKLSVRMLTSNTIPITSIQPVSFLIGDFTTYTITLQSPSQIQKGDTLTMSLSDLSTPTQVLVCNGIQGFPVDLNCSINKKSIVIQLTSVIPALDVIQYTIQGLRNPYSNVLSAPLNIQFKDQEGYLMSQASFIDVARRGNRYGFDAVNLQHLEIKPDSLLVGRVTTFKIDFTLPLPVKSNLNIVVSLSSEIGLSDQPLECFFTLKGIAQSTRSICQYQKATHSIEIINFYPPPSLRHLKEYQSLSSLGYQNYFNSRMLPDIIEIPIYTPITVSLSGIKNKITNGPFKTDESSQMKVQLCSIENSNSESKYKVLAQSTFNLPPSFICSQPCSNCSGIDTTCTSCKESMILQPEDGKCQKECPYLFSYIQQSSNYNFPVCLRCSVQYKDSHCAGCSPQDLSKCTVCIEKFKLINDNNKEDYCEEITSKNDPLRIFVYDIEFNLPYICTYIICFTLYVMIRKIWMMKNLQVVVVLISAFSLIETIVLIAFVVKIALLEKFLPILIVSFLLAGYFIIQNVYAHKFSKSLITDSGYTLFEPSYKTIRVISKIALFINFKVYLMHRSQFSIIRDVYSIPFNNCQQHLQIIKRGLQMSLAFGILLFCFIFWAMYYTYNYRNVLIPPFFFIEFAFFHFLICILLIILLFPHQNLNIDILFDIENESSNKYKIKQLDLNGNAPSSVILLSKHQQILDPSNPMIQVPLSYLASNNNPTSSNNEQAAVSRIQPPRSTISLNSQINNFSLQLNNQEILQKPYMYESKLQCSKTNIKAINNNKFFQNKNILFINDNQETQPINLVPLQGLNQSIVGFNQNIDNSLNQEMSSSNFNSGLELQDHSHAKKQSTILPPLIICNPSQQEHLLKQQGEHTQAGGHSPYSLLGDELNSQKMSFSNKNSSDGASGLEIKSANKNYYQINRQNYQVNAHTQKQLASVQDENKQFQKNEFFDESEQFITANFANQVISSQQEQKLKIFVTPQKNRSLSSSSLTTPQSQSTQRLQQDNLFMKNTSPKLFNSQTKITQEQHKQQQSEQLSQSTNYFENKLQSQNKQNNQHEEEENDVEQEQQDSNRMNLQQQMALSKQHTNNFQNSKATVVSNIPKNFSDMLQANKIANKNVNQKSSSQTIMNSTNLQNMTNGESSKQNICQDQLSKKYTESSEEVEEGYCQNVQNICNNFFQENQFTTNHMFLKQRSDYSNGYLSQKLEFQSPRDQYNENLQTKLNQNFEQNEQGTPQIGKAFQNSLVNLEKNVSQKCQDKQYPHTLSNKEDRQFSQFIQGMDPHQNEASPNHNCNRQVLNLNKNIHPSQSQAQFSQNVHLTEINQSPLYSFSNPSKIAQISSNQIVSKFDLNFGEGEKLEIINPTDVPQLKKKNQLLNKHQKDDNISEMTKYTKIENSNFNQQSNQIHLNNRNPLIAHNFLNSYASISLKQSVDSRSSQYFPN